MLDHGSNCSLARAMNGRIMRCGIISSCQSAATSEITKALLGICHRVSSSISSIRPLPFTFFQKPSFSVIRRRLLTAKSSDKMGLCLQHLRNFGQICILAKPGLPELLSAGSYKLLELKCNFNEIIRLRLKLQTGNGTVIKSRSDQRQTTLKPDFQRHARSGERPHNKVLTVA